MWTYARDLAVRLAKGKCRVCGSTDSIEVNHIVPLAGAPRTQSCSHHQSNLEVLCRRHHVEVTAEQRAAGLLGPGAPPAK